ncbi:hypothetical protein VTO42DRAFT_8965 [Malbranchea cinnamomea]
MDEQPQSLQTLFASAKAQKASLEEDSPTTNPQYQELLDSAISTFEKCQTLVSKLSLFSTNESLEDIATADLQYLTLDYLFAEVLQRVFGSDRLKNLRRTRAEYERYLERLDNYGLLSSDDKKLYERYLENPNSFSLTPMNDAAARREAKIARFREEKELKQRLEYLSQNPDLLRNDDDAVRRLQLAEINLFIHQTFQALDMLAQELTLLEAAQAAGPPRTQRQEDDSRGRNNIDRSGYSERLDIGLTSKGRGGPLLSKTGVPLQPFVLTSRRAEIQKGVFRPGHNLPTMTIEEYLEEERRRGGIIEGGEQSGAPKEIDEDDMEKADEETMKARAWDEFKEEHPRGSGNTLNRG